MTQRTINLVTSQISHGVIDLSALENNPTAHEVLTGYRPSMIRLILLNNGEATAIYNWYSTKPDKMCIRDRFEKLLEEAKQGKYV